jgi:UDP-N-acetylglucosamine--N-acetylmuramyl-(pentapeptide) pyrophosphoryl-undecaprenol N-acetylglucosamine transferase
MSRAQTIVLTGGGSGGHIMPVLAVAAALKQANPKIMVIYIGQKGDKLADIPAQDHNIDAVFTVRAGKYRRYHGLGWRQLLDVKTVLLNIRDLGFIAMGLVQSWLLMRRIKPGVIFTRGGFVSVPVALAGRLNGVPYITHDSDSTPSLANRLIASWASLHAVALPEEVYHYPADKTLTVGVPIGADYGPVTDAQKSAFRKQVGLPEQARVLLITGGGNGAHNLNMIVLANSPTLLKRYPDLKIVHIAGRALAESLGAAYDQLLTPKQREQVQVLGFTSDLHVYSGAADVVIIRGGATNLAEFAAQSKACIVVPSPQLIWNVKNAETLAAHQAIVEITEVQADQEGRLGKLVADLLDQPAARTALGKRLNSFARTDAAEKLARILIDQAGHK